MGFLFDDNSSRQQNYELPNETNVQQPQLGSQEPCTDCETHEEATVSASSDLPVPSTQQQSTHPMQTRLKSGIRKPNLKYVLSTAREIPKEPKTVKGALSHPGWRKAMIEELEALELNQTWELVPRSSEMNIVGCKWVFKAKLNAEGNLDKLKARLVAKEYHQEEGVDFVETFSLAVKQATVRIVISVAIVKRWFIHQLDVKNTFLHWSLNEMVFMEQPPGFVSSTMPNSVCLLKKALYGLKQAPRAWFEKFSNFLLERGFYCSSTDPSLFVLHTGQYTWTGVE